MDSRLAKNGLVRKTWFSQSMRSVGTMRARGSRSVALNIGRSQGSIRRSICRRNIVVLLAKFRNGEPVLARGFGRLTFEFTAL